MSHGDMVALASALATMARDSNVEATRVHAQMETVLEEYAKLARSRLSTGLKSVELEGEREGAELKTQLKSGQLALERERERGRERASERERERERASERELLKTQLKSVQLALELASDR